MCKFVSHNNISPLNSPPTFCQVVCWLLRNCSFCGETCYFESRYYDSWSVCFHVARLTWTMSVVSFQCVLIFRRCCYRCRYAFRWYWCFRAK